MSITLYCIENALRTGITTHIVNETDFIHGGLVKVALSDHHTCLYNYGVEIFDTKEAALQEAERMRTTRIKKLVKQLNFLTMKDFEAELNIESVQIVKTIASAKKHLISEHSASSYQSKSGRHDEMLESVEGWKMYDHTQLTADQVYAIKCYIESLK